MGKTIDIEISFDPLREKEKKRTVWTDTIFIPVSAILTIAFPPIGILFFILGYILKRD